MRKLLQGWNLLTIGAVIVGQIVFVEAAQGESLLAANELPDTALTTNKQSPLLTQTSETVQIIDIRLNVTETGVDISLITAGETLSLPQTEVVNDALVAEISNATLALAEDEFLVFEPAEGIAVIQAVNLPENIVQLSITGADAPPVADVTSEAQTLQFSVVPVASVASIPAEEPLRLVVTGEETSRYVVPAASTATRTDTPLDEIPQSIQVIPEEILEDQQVIRLNDALRNASGVVSNSLDQRGQRFIIRGFSSSSVLRDGFRQTNGSSGNSGFQELANIEQIEVLKGPASILSGALEPGGAINLVTKKPLSEPFYELGLRAGNRELIEPSIDISGPLTEDGRLLYRLNALYRNEDYHRDFDVPVERFFIAPILSWAISDRTDLTVELEYSDETRPADFGGIPIIGDRVADIPFDRITGEPDDDASNESLRLGYQFEHRFSDSWKARNSFRYISLDSNFVSNVALRTIESTGDLFRAWVQNAQPSDSYELQTNVVGEFATGSIEHTLLAGVDLYRRDAKNNRRFDFTRQPLFNVFDPVYGLVSRPDSFSEPPPEVTDFRTDNLGIYIQDQVTLSDNLFLLAGLRYDTVTADIDDLERNTSDSQSSDAFTPRLGLVYQPVENLSLYTSYSTSFVPNSAIDRSGDLLEPEEGRQFEIGAKAELLDGRLTTNLALFNITKQNVATADPDALPGEPFAVATGEQRSQGVELDVIGEILPGWDIVANYAYTDADITEDNNGLEDNRIFGVPEHNANLWTNYEIQQGDLTGLGFGIGVNYVDSRFGDNENSYVLEDYFLTNAAVSYRKDNWRAALNFRNLFDVDYIDSSEGSRSIENRPGEGFTFVGSFTIEF
ncbi:MAG: TonB-dependent receptor [Cyanobacteria bacterium P01_B01_bin.77]